MDNHNMKALVADRISQFKGCEEELAEYLGVSTLEVISWRNGALPTRVPTKSQFRKLLRFVPSKENNIASLILSQPDEFTQMSDSIKVMTKEMEKAGVFTWIERLNLIARELKS